MIKYSLHCDQNHEFEGWFRNSDDCEAQTRDGLLQCPICGSTKISKSLMMPRVSGTRSQDNPKMTPVEAGTNAVSSQCTDLGADPGKGSDAELGAAPDKKQMQEMLRAFRDHVVENSDYVGDKFAEEARKMHFEESKPRGIYGEATSDEVKSLSEDGIDCLPLPVLPEDQN